MLGETTDGLQIGTTPQTCRFVAPKALAELDPPRSLIYIYGICNSHYFLNPTGFGSTSPKSGTDPRPKPEHPLKASPKQLYSSREQPNSAKLLDRDDRW